MNVYNASIIMYIPTYFLLNELNIFAIEHTRILYSIYYIPHKIIPYCKKRRHVKVLLHWCNIICIIWCAVA